MHEMGIVSSILEASEKTAEREGATRINEIRVRVGELTEIIDEAMYFAFESLAPGTMAEGARLIIDHVPARSKCVECGVGFGHGRFDITCPECGSYFCELVQGQELDIECIDVELAEEAVTSDGVKES